MQLTAKHLLSASRYPKLYKNGPVKNVNNEHIYAERHLNANSRRHRTQFLISTLFVSNTGINVKLGNIKNYLETPSTGNGPVLKTTVEEFIRQKWVKPETGDYV